MKPDSPNALYLHELEVLHDAEGQLIKALSQLAKAASSKDLRLAIEKHLNQTQEHLQRLNLAFSLLKENPKPMTCKAMKGLLEEGEEMIQAVGDPALKDAGLISVVRRVEHLKMAGNGCGRAYAEALSEEGAAELPRKTRDEVRSTDASLREPAENLIPTEPVHA